MRVAFERGFVFCRRGQETYKWDKCDVSERGTLLCPLHHCPVRTKPHHYYIKSKKSGIKPDALSVPIRGRVYIPKKH